MKSTINIIILILITIIFSDIKASRICVDNFGAMPNDSNDDTQSIYKAFNYAVLNNIDTLEFVKGCYTVSSDTNICLNISNIKNMTILGNNSEIICSTLSSIISINESESLNIHDLKFDYFFVNSIGVKVLALTDTGYRVKVLPPYHAEQGRIVEGILAYNPDQKQPDSYHIDHYNSKPNPFRVSCYTDDIIDIPTDFTKKSSEDIGRYLLIRYKIYGNNIFTFKKCKNINLQNIHIFSAPGMGILAEHCEDIYIKKCFVGVRNQSGYWMSTNADATHFRNCKGNIRIEDSDFSSMGDDAVNVHNMVMKVESIDGNIVTLKKGERVYAFFDVKKGDMLEISSGAKPFEDPLILYVDSIISHRIDGSISFKVKPNTKLSGYKDEDICCNASLAPSLQIINCRVRNNRARGMLIQTRDVLIEHCKFNNCSGGAIQITSDTDHWWEGLPCENIEIRHCEFNNVNYGAGKGNAAIDIFIKNKFENEGVGIHRKIQIEHNRFVNITEYGIHVGSASNVLIRKNIFENNTSGAIVIKNSENVHVEDNEAQKCNLGIRFMDTQSTSGLKNLNNIGFDN